MLGGTRKSGGGGRHVWRGRHRLEHWYRDNQVYFLTARVRDQHPAFDSDQAKRIFWDRFEHHTQAHGFTPGVTSLLSNHYHCLGYLRCGNQLGAMMRKVHGSVAKLVNDVRAAQGAPRLVPFWRQSQHHDYFDGCIRDEKQARLAYRYTLMQAVRHGIVDDWRDHPHTRVKVELERAVKRAAELDAFLRGVRYRRYQQPPQ